MKKTLVEFHLKISGFRVDPVAQRKSEEIINEKLKDPRFAPQRGRPFIQEETTVYV
jgi:hypothetical protein